MARTNERSAVRFSPSIVCRRQAPVINEHESIRRNSKEEAGIWIWRLVLRTWIVWVRLRFARWHPQFSFLFTDFVSGQ